MCTPANGMFDSSPLSALSSQGRPGLLGLLCAKEGGQRFQVQEMMGTCDSSQLSGVVHSAGQSQVCGNEQNASRINCAALLTFKGCTEPAQPMCTSTDVHAGRHAQVHTTHMHHAPRDKGAHTDMCAHTQAPAFSELEDFQPWKGSQFDQELRGVTQNLQRGGDKVAAAGVRAWQVSEGVEGTSVTQARLSAIDSHGQVSSSIN